MKSPDHFRKRTLQVIVIALTCYPAAALSVQWDFAVTAPTMGSSISPGQDITVTIDRLTNVSPDVVYAVSDCFDEPPKYFPPKDVSITWTTRVRKDLDPRKTCSVVAGGIIFNKSGTGRTLLYARPLALIPIRNLTISQLSLVGGWGVDVGGCNVVPLTGLTPEGEWLNVTFDRGTTLSIEDTSIAFIIGPGTIEGRRAGSTKLFARYLNKDGSVVASSFQIEVDRTEDPRPPCVSRSSPVTATDSRRETTGPGSALVGARTNGATRDEVPATPAASKNLPTMTKQSGTLVWSGIPDKNGLISIDGQQTANGMLRGDFLPGVPVKITVSPSDIVPSKAPAPSNGYKLLELRSPRRANMIVTIRWDVIPVQ